MTHDPGPEVLAFLADLTEVYEKHKMCVGWDIWGEHLTIDGWDNGHRCVVDALGELLEETK